MIASLPAGPCLVGKVHVCQSRPYPAGLRLVPG
jgi:hypothetical protein